MTLKPYQTCVELETSELFIRDNFKRCLEKHKYCSKRTKSILPRRVIDLSSSTYIRLIEPQGLEAQYATLSHCWGQGQPLQTTKSTHADMLCSIPGDSLPIVFKQAILVARGLGISYIWIDSLCIIQDSREDWELESAKMCDYYSNSYLNISVGSSPSHDVAFLTKRDPSWYPNKFTLEDGFNKIYDIYAKRVPSLARIDDGGPLYSRAWAWQEAAMAAQTVHFMAGDLVWQCQEGIFPEHFTPSYRGLFSIGLLDHITSKQCRFVMSYIDMAKANAVFVHSRHLA